MALEASASASAQTGVRALAVMTGSFLSGTMMGISIVNMPVLLGRTAQLRPSQLLHQFVHLFDLGHRMMPSMAISTCLLHGYVATTRRAAGQPWTLPVLAAVATIGMVPFTWLVMMPTNNVLFRLHKAAAGQEAGASSSSSSSSSSPVDVGQVHGLLVRWSWLHAVRSLFPLVGAAVGMVGLLSDSR